MRSSPLHRSRFLTPATHGALAARLGEPILLIALSAVARAFLRARLVRHLVQGGGAAVETDSPGAWFDHPRLSISPRRSARGERLTVLDPRGSPELTIEVAPPGAAHTDPDRAVIVLVAPPLAEVRRRGSPVLTAECDFLSAPAAMGWFTPARSLRPDVPGRRRLRVLRPRRRRG